MSSYRRRSYQDRRGSSRRSAADRRRRSRYPPRRGFSTALINRGIEWKYSDSQLVNSDCNTTAGITLLNDMQNGNSAITRLGNQIMIRSLEFRILHKALDATGSDQVHRFAFVIDRQPNGVVFSATDLWVAADTISLRNLDNRRRFKVLWDQSIVVNGHGEPGSYNVIYKYIKFKKPILVEYNSLNGGTIADIVNNAFFFIEVGNVAPGTGAGKFNLECRLRFTDV